MPDGNRIYVSHAAEQAHARYGVLLGLGDMIALANQCRDGKAVLLKRTGKTEHRIVSHDGTAMVTVYNPATNVIITFLPPTNSQTGATKYRGLMLHKRPNSKARCGSRAKKHPKPKPRRGRFDDELDCDEG